MENSLRILNEKEKCYYLKAFKSILVSLIRKVAIYEYDRLFGKAWREFYDLANNILGYDIRNRPGKNAVIDKIKLKEFPKYIKIAADLCKIYEIDTNNDAEEYKKLLIHLKNKENNLFKLN